jgi:Tfp pilus assembly protein PilO
MEDKQRKDLSFSLNQFYNKPVAVVSFELLLSLGLVIFLGLFAIKPTLTTMSDLIKEIDDKKALNEQLTKKIAALGTAQTLYLSLEDRLGLLDEAIPSQPELIKSLKVVEKLAGENNVVIESISVASIPNETPSEVSNGKLQRVPLPVNVSVVGDYVSIRAYVEALRNIRRSYVVDTVTFSIEENRGQRKLRASITLNLPYFGLPS